MENKKRKKKRSNTLKFLKRLLIVLAIIAILALIFLFAFRIQYVHVEGNTRYSDEEILDLLNFEEQSQNTLVFYLKNRSFEAENIPFIDAVHVEYGSRDTIDIQVIEKKIVGCIESNESYYYFDSEGVVCEVAAGYESDVPKIEGLKFKNLALNAVLEVDDPAVYDALLSLTLLLEKYALTVEKVVFEEDDSLNMQMGYIRVLLGDAKNLEDKISELSNLLPKLENLRGTLHLENYDSTKDSIIFTKE